jgi:tetratricopeptide (TPR) repeat protein
MLRSTVLSRISTIASRRLPIVALALGLVAMPACGKKGEETANPEDGGGKSAAQVKADIEKAKQEAKVSQLIVLANKDLDNGRYVSAAKLADEALVENPDNADAYAVLGASRWRAGDFEGSNEAFRKALELDPKNYGAALGLARNLQAEGKHLEAAAIQDKVLADDPEQLEPRLSKLWSYYAVCDAENAIKVIDEIFPRMAKDDQLLPLVQAYAAFMRPFEGKGPLCAVEGDKGNSNLDLNLTYGLKYAGATIGKEFGQVVFLETREEAVIDTNLAKTLGLKELAKYKPPGAEAEVGIVLIPEIKFGKLSLVNIPATIQPLEAYTDATGGETPGVILGRQALQGLGTVTFDFPGHTLELAKAAPAGPAEGEVELPMLMLSMHVAHAPVVPVSIDGSDHRFYAYLGFTYGSGLSVSKKHYLKSGHLPRQIDPPDDPEAGLKMVYLDSFTLGGKRMPGTSGLVLVKEPADPTLDVFLRNTRFEVGGHINLSMLQTWRVTFALGEGKLYVKPAA